jgi:hypothetical protein
LPKPYKQTLSDKTNQIASASKYAYSKTSTETKITRSISSSVKEKLTSTILNE